MTQKKQMLRLDTRSMNKGAERPTSMFIPVAGEDLLSNLDGDVTLLSPLVQTQQISSEARGWLKNSIWREVKMDEEEEQEGVSDEERL